jgi:glucose-6-phosphate isomerase
VNPAALLALAWYRETGGRGLKDMVVLPYKDRLLLLSRYLQQLVMESLGKEKDLSGNTVHQGLAVYGNKGSTDQHAFVQQLREGVPNFFATFVEVLKDRRDGLPSLSVEEDVTAGDYLHGFLLGTREALTEKGRGSVTITVGDVSARSIGALVALFERTVGLYALLVGINAYHQPGVEAGKRAAAAVLDVQRALLAAMRSELGTFRSAEAWAKKAEVGAETAWKVLEHLSANPDHGVTRRPGEDPFASTYGTS